MNDQKIREILSAYVEEGMRQLNEEAFQADPTVMKWQVQIMYILQNMRRR